MAKLQLMLSLIKPENTEVGEYDRKLQDGSAYNILCQYCVENDINIINLTEEEFDGMATSIEYFDSAQSYHTTTTPVYFWLDWIEE